MSETEISESRPVTERSESPIAIPTTRGPGVALMALVVAILGVGMLVTAKTSHVSNVSEPGVRLDSDGTPFLADQAGDWTGGEKQGLSKIEQDLLPKDTEGARRLFKNKNGDELYCSIILAGREVTSIHRPELCLPGQGWRIESEYTERVPAAGAPGGALRVMRMNGARSVPLPGGRMVELRSVFVYWFIGKNRMTPYHWQRIYWTTKDRVLHNTNHRWAYILIHVSIGNDVAESGATKSEDDAMKVAGKFVQDIYPTLVEK
jgi:hypothetical protein